MTVLPSQAPSEVVPIALSGGGAKPLSMRYFLYNRGGRLSIFDFFGIIFIPPFPDGGFPENLSPYGSTLRESRIRFESCELFGVINNGSDP